MAQEPRIAQAFVLFVADTVLPVELDLGASVVEFLYSTDPAELDLASSVVEYLAERFPPSPVVAIVDPIASSYVPGPRAQLTGRPQGG